MNITEDISISFSWWALVAVIIVMLLRKPLQRAVVWWGNQIPRTHIWVEVKTQTKVREATRWEIIHHYHPVWNIDRLVGAISLVLSGVIGCAIVCIGFYIIPFLMKYPRFYYRALLLPSIVVLSNLALFGIFKWTDSFISKWDALRTEMQDGFSRLRLSGEVRGEVSFSLPPPRIPLWLLLIMYWHVEWIFISIAGLVGLLFTIGSIVFPINWKVLLTMLKYAFIISSFLAPSFILLFWISCFGYLFFVKK